MRHLLDRLARLERTTEGSDPSGPVIFIPHNFRDPMPDPSETWPVVVYDPADPPPEAAELRGSPG